MDKARHMSRGPTTYSLGGSTPSKVLGLFIALVLCVCCLSKLSGTLPEGSNRELAHQALTVSVESLPEASKLENGEPHVAISSLPRPRPRILTILTTYDQNAEYIKAYKRGLKVRQDGFQPKVGRISTRMYTL